MMFDAYAVELEYYDNDEHERRGPKYIVFEGLGDAVMLGYEIAYTQRCRDYDNPSSVYVIGCDDCDYDSLATIDSEAGFICSWMGCDKYIKLPTSDF